MTPDLKPGQRWRSVLGDGEEAVEIVQVTEVTVDYRDLCTRACHSAMLDVFAVLYRLDTDAKPRARRAVS